MDRIPPRGGWSSHHLFLRAELGGLIIACPVPGRDPQGCPFRSLRTQPLSDRMAWVDSLPADQMQAFVDYHHACEQR